MYIWQENVRQYSRIFEWTQENVRVVFFAFSVRGSLYAKANWICVRNSARLLKSCTENESSLFIFLCRNYMNDALRTDVFVRYQPETIACACIFLSARKSKVILVICPIIIPVNYILVFESLLSHCIAGVWCFYYFCKNTGSSISISCLVHFQQGTMKRSTYASRMLLEF